MRKGKIVPLALLSIFLSTCALAQTLDEVLHPLLKKGQWDLSLDYKNFGYEYFSIDLFHGKMTYFDSQVILFPRLAFGLAKNLQLTIDGAYQFPITFSAPQFEEWDYWRETNTIRSLSAQLLFRPAGNMELSLFLLHGRAKEDTHYPYTWGVDAHYTKDFTGDILILGGTWLSAVDGESRPLRADLDGLQGPLLKKGRWRIEPEILVRSHEYEYRHRYDVLPDYIDENVDSIDTSLRLAASHGLTDHMQVKAEGYWQPKFRIRTFSRASIWWDDTEHSRESDTSRYYFDNWGGRGSLLWRPSPQLEVNLAIANNRVKTGYEEKKNQAEAAATVKTANLIASDKHIITQIDLLATRLSKPKRPGVPFIADLPGIYHPLLEKKQLRRDYRISYSSYREIDKSSDGMWDRDSWLFLIQYAYGISNSFQASAYYGICLFRNWFSDFKYVKEHTSGMELTWRLKKRFEICAGLNYKPMVFPDIYRPFVLGIHEQLFGSDFYNFLSTNFGESLNIELGCKLMF